MNVQSTGRLNAQLGAIKGTSDSLTLESLGVEVTGHIETADRGAVLTSLHDHIAAFSDAIDLASAEGLADRLGALRGEVTTISLETANLLGVEGLGDVAVLKDIARLCDVIRKDIDIEEFRMAGSSPPGVTSEMVSAQVNRLPDQNLATLGDLYARGPEVLELLTHEPNAAILLHQLGVLQDHSPTTLLQLYADGATSRQIDVLMVSEPDGARLHDVLGRRGPLAVGDVVRLYETCPNTAEHSATEKVARMIRDPFGADVVTRAGMGEKLRVATLEGLHRLYGLDEAIREGFRNIIHFGNNTTKEGVGVAAKGSAMKLYGGTELTFANIQDVIKLINNGEGNSGPVRAETRELVMNIRYVRNVNNAKISCARLEYALQRNEKICFHLDMFNHDIITAIRDQDESFHIGKFYPVKNSVTAQELNHIIQNWDRFGSNVVFMRGLEPVAPPHIP